MKIVSLSPSLTDIVRAIGGEYLLAGVTDHCPEISGFFHRLGSPKALNLAQIEALKPDFILSDQGDNRPEEMRKLQGFKILSFNARSVPAVMDTVAEIGRALNLPGGAGALNEKIKTSYDAARAKAAGKDPLHTLILLWDTPLLTINFDTYASRLLESCGAYNSFHTDPVHEIPIEIEDMIDKDPKLLLLASEPYPFKKRNLKKFREYKVFSKIPIELVSGHYLSRYGPVTAEALDFFSALIEKSRQFAPVSSPS